MCMAVIESDTDCDGWEQSGNAYVYATCSIDQPKYRRDEEKTRGEYIKGKGSLTLQKVSKAKDQGGRTQEDHPSPK